MPRRLLDRCQPDCIREFRESAAQRFQDGLSAAVSDRRTAAIYLWGYTAEMTLKAAYFAAVGFAETQVITLGNLWAAFDSGISLGVPWRRAGALHNVRAWAELLVAYRSSRPGLAYSMPSFGIEVQARGQSLGRLWNESLRYHRNVAYPYEVRQVRQAAEWLLIHSPSL